MNKCLIRWSGSKRTQAKNIVDLFPDEFDTYYEPFIGGSSVLIELLKRDIKCNKYVLSDKNEHLISFYNMLICNPEYLIDKYSENWHLLNDNAESDSEKNDRYISIRDRFNQSHDIGDFYFITKTCYTGLIRYNKSGEFNVGFHYGRCGEYPDSVCKLLRYYSSIFNSYNMEFICCDYLDISPSGDDFMYLDPPYSGTDTSMYLGDFNEDSLYKFLRKQKCSYALSYNGKTARDDSFVQIPYDLYVKRFDIHAGRSFRSGYKVKDFAKDNTFDSLYVNYDVDVKNVENYNKKLF